MLWRWGLFFLSMPSKYTTPSREGNVIGLDVLSLRERQVLELVANGLNNQQIGQQLALSPNTIARRSERIMHKLNMHSRTELVKFPTELGWFGCTINDKLPILNLA